jgi:hypothetical protein
MRGRCGAVSCFQAEIPYARINQHMVLEEHEVIQILRPAVFLLARHSQCCDCSIALPKLA